MFKHLKVKYFIVHLYPQCVRCVCVCVCVCVFAVRNTRRFADLAQGFQLHHSGPEERHLQQGIVRQVVQGCVVVQELSPLQPQRPLFGWSTRDRRRWNRMVILDRVPLFSEEKRDENQTLPVQHVNPRGCVYGWILENYDVKSFRNFILMF